MKSVLDKNITMCRRAIEPDKIAVVNLLEVLKSDKYADIVQQCRALPKDQQQVFKKNNVPVITVSGIFKDSRKESNLTNHTGLICLDLDGIEDIISLKEKITQQPYTAYCGRSIGGKGLFVIVPIPKCSPGEHKNRYEAIERLFIKEFGINGTIDPAPKSVAACRFVSFDEQAYFNHDAVLLDLLPEPKIEPEKWQVKRHYGSHRDYEKVALMVDKIQDRKLDFCPEYDDFLKIAFSLSVLGEEGRELFHAVCQYSPKYEYSDADKKFTNALKTAAGKVGLGTFFGYCKDYGLMNDEVRIKPIRIKPRSPKKDKLSISELRNQLEAASEAFCSGAITIDEYCIINNRINDELLSRKANLRDFVRHGTPKQQFKDGFLSNPAMTDQEQKSVWQVYQNRGLQQLEAREVLQELIKEHGFVLN